MTSEQDQEQAFSEGKEAAMAGSPRTDSQKIPKELRSFWLDGWDFGCKKRLREYYKAKKKRG